MLSKIVQQLHALQRKLPGFFTFGLWIIMFIAFYMGQKTLGYALLAFLLAKVVVQVSYIFMLSRKMSRLVEARKSGNSIEEAMRDVQEFTKHTQMNMTEERLNQTMEQFQGGGFPRQYGGNVNDTGKVSNQNDEEEFIEDIEFEEVEEHEIEEYKGFSIGQVVRVKEGVYDPDFKDLDLSGYQGRIKFFEEPNDKSLEMLVMIEWDSESLKSFDNEHIIRCEDEGVEWTQIYLSVLEIEKGVHRDTPKLVEKTIKKILKEL